ncbi:transferase hexapeptide repeat containing protein [Leptolyngbya sp. Heron Island J]|uniref:acyltransferase n=1 Tax=Leptolyngbya sp. Heron Island J TaxID=1385935 RepID=UPI0003B93F99|nr:acyltransferase [Leptolyngbya sp. Heron Island J]ESA38663.1 transferase hexapeptide repeat containing protein [Leptolyngbya sp. Heron Island J]
MFELIKRIKFALGKEIVKLVFWAEPAILEENNRRTIAQIKYCGKAVRLNGRIAIVQPQKLEIHDNVHIGDNAYIDARGGIVIDENTHISRNFVVHSANHRYEGDYLPYDETYEFKPITIERNVWIGTNVVVVPGVSIGEGAIIGAGAVVTQDVPSFAVFGNQPGRVIKFRDQTHYRCLDNAKAYSGAKGKPI